MFENESRIIFSARFGDGKSYFLNEFMKSYDEKKNDYYFITLHPVNYVVEENRDVIEYIKRDILFQLIKDNRIYDFKEGYDKIFDAVCNVESLFKLADYEDLKKKVILMMNSDTSKLKQYIKDTFRAKDFSVDVYIDRLEKSF